MPVLYLFVKNEVCSSFILFVEEHGPFQAKLWDEHDDGVLPHKQDVPFFIKDASALEEQLERKRDSSIFKLYYHDIYIYIFLHFRIITADLFHTCAFTCVWNATDAL